MDVPGDEVTTKEENHVANRDVLLFFLCQLNGTRKELVSPRFGDVEVVAVESGDFHRLHFFLNVPVTCTHHHSSFRFLATHIRDDGMNLVARLDLQESIELTFNSR